MEDSRCRIVNIHIFDALKILINPQTLFINILVYLGFLHCGSKLWFRFQPVCTCPLEKVYPLGRRGLCSWKAYTFSFGWEVVMSLENFTFHGSFMEFGGKIWIQLTDAEIFSRKVLNGWPKGVKKGGVSQALICLYRLSRQSGYNMCYSSPFPIGWGITAKCTLLISNFPSICHECPECMDLHH